MRRILKRINKNKTIYFIKEQSNATMGNDNKRICEERKHQTR